MKTKLIMAKPISRSCNKILAIINIYKCQYKKINIVFRSYAFFKMLGYT